MNIYAFSSLLASYVCFLLGILVYQKDPKNQLNRIFTLLCISLGYTAFVEFGCRQAADFAAASQWFKMGAFWPFVLAFLVHFILVFTEKSKALGKILFAVYAPAAIFSVWDLTTTLVSGIPQKEYWGWTYTIPENPLMYVTSTIWGFSLAIFSFTLCLLYFYRARERIKKQQAKLVLIGMVIPLVAGSFTDGIFPVVGIRVPELSIPALTVGVIFIVYSMRKYRLFVLSPTVAAEDIVASMSNLLFLVKDDGTVSRVNQAALQLLGYGKSELTDRPLKNIFADCQRIHALQKRLNDSAEPDVITNEETILKTKDGKTIPVLLSVSVIRDKDGNNMGMVCVASDLTDRKRAEEAQRKEILLREIHHRVKNNMQIIYSLLNLQSRYLKDERDLEMIRESQNRIRSMALVHEKLYRSEDLEHIDFRDYITDVVHRLVRTYGTDVALTMEVDNVSLGADAAVPCGLIINELVSNALKHAFPDKKGEVTVAFHTVDGSIELRVKDNGIGLPENVDFRAADTLGLRLVTILAEDQLSGEITLTRHEGTEFCIVFEPS